MHKQNVMAALKAAFFEGYNSYQTPAISYTSVEEAWENSDAKFAYDAIDSGNFPQRNNRR